MKYDLEGLNLTQVYRVHASLASWKTTMVAWSRHLLRAMPKFYQLSLQAASIITKAIPATTAWVTSNIPSVRDDDNV